MKVLLLPIVFFGAALTAQTEPLKVAVSVAPQAGFVERIGGKHIEVTTLVDEGQNPHGFAPTPKKVTEVAGTAVWFTSGMAFEKPLAEKLTGTKLISLTEGIELHEHESHAHEEHDHKHEHEDEKHHGHKRDHDHHDHAGPDTHTWLSPPLIQQQAHTIAHALADLDPEHAEFYEENAEALEHEAADLHERLSKQLAPLKGSTFYVFHAAFGYFAKTYGLEQKAIETGGREPSPKHLTHLIEEAREDGVKILLVQPQFSQASARKIAKAIDAAVVSIDPLDKDVLGTLAKLADAVERTR